MPAGVFRSMLLQQNHHQSATARERAPYIYINTYIYGTIGTTLVPRGTIWYHGMVHVYVRTNRTISQKRLDEIQAPRCNGDTTTYHGTLYPTTITFHHYISYQHGVVLEYQNNGTRVQWYRMVVVSVVVESV
jgi:hypothetical protein